MHKVAEVMRNVAEVMRKIAEVMRRIAEVMIFDDDPMHHECYDDQMHHIPLKERI